MLAHLGARRSARAAAGLLLQSPRASLSFEDGEGFDARNDGVRSRVERFHRRRNTRQLIEVIARIRNAMMMNPHQHLHKSFRHDPQLAQGYVAIIELPVVAQTSR